MIDRIMASYGSAVELGLVDGRLATRPKVAYLLLGEGACRGRCAFCSQPAAGSHGHVARVSWPKFPLDSVLDALHSSRSIERVCFQCPDEEAVRQQLPYLVAMASRDHPVSVSMPPWGADFMAELKVAGADRLTIPLDCASPRLFREVKGKEMQGCLDALRDAVTVFGRGMVGTHLIVGLGETEEEVVKLAGRLLAMGAVPSLFALTPVKGTAMEWRTPPPIATYRRLQLALHIMAELRAESRGFSFDGGGHLTRCPIEKDAMKAAIHSGKPFETKGCPGCNRPYFNERVTGPLYNFPRPPSQGELIAIEEELHGIA
jgi:biotin synthase-related radical SAM superfamily protein